MIFQVQAPIQIAEPGLFSEINSYIAALKIKKSWKIKL